ncbi:sensor histidine kinase [Kribbella qitaiheensis]|uniref:histidine kinase n=1 Tax=Kribbella qitaiheensis TaxID=1544730 RepID=A0A7G6WV34_9ACTN|nr:sensor histidine kinase [Kribbella qitaiheensis]QNE17849.1 sensor histidine kinase [Kribbella qitaiheensis]
MLRNAVRSLWAEPRAPQPPVRVWRDWVLVGLLVPTAILEGIFREHLIWRPVALAFGVCGVILLLWRRTHPFAVVAVAFGALIVLDIVSLINVHSSVGLYTMVCVVLLPYSLFRWGSGREIGVGLMFVLTALAVGLAVDYTGVGNAVAGSMFLLFPAALGAAVRFRTSARTRELDQVRLREREQLARELHDTVAHHVSAILIRAQAGRVVAGSDPGAAVDALSVIEAEASRTLAEMRTMVAGLRADEAAALAPQPGVADLERLARGTTGDRLLVDVGLSGDLDDLAPSVGAAIYRIAQESITNAVRHARDATRVEVRVAADEGCVRLTIRDDGSAGSAGPVGYGLVGMTERATLLGGSFEAGPGPDRGWTVEAVLPKGAR